MDETLDLTGDRDSPGSMPGTKPRYKWRSEPQMQVEVTFKMASVCTVGLLTMTVMLSILVGKKHSYVPGPRPKA